MRLGNFEFNDTNVYRQVVHTVFLTINKFEVVEIAPKFLTLIQKMT